MFGLFLNLKYIPLVLVACFCWTVNGILLRVTFHCLVLCEEVLTFTVSALDGARRVRVAFLGLSG